MKKQIVSAIVLAGMIASSSAFASNARQMVMGTGGAGAYSNGGSFYYDHAYNFFYNPAYVNDFKNFVIFEKGDGADGSSAGFVTSMMNFNLGLFLNRDAALSTGHNAVDLMFGGDAGVKWGLGLTHGYGSTGATKSKDFTARVGISVNGFDPFVRMKFMGEDEVAGVETNEYKDIGFGLRYHYGEWVPYIVYDMAKTRTGVGAADAKDNDLIIGVGRETKIAEGARLVYALYWRMHKETSAAGVDSKSNYLPLDLAVEADVLSWLTLRGGFNHLLNNAGNESTARVGGSFHIGKVDVDYAFGNSSSAGGTTTVTPDSSDVGFDSGTFHTVGMRYSW